MEADDKTTRGVLAAIDEAFKAYGGRDIARFLDVYAPDPDVVFVGRNERFVGLEEIRSRIEEAWAQSDSEHLTLGWTSVSSAGPVAWVAADATVHTEIMGRKLADDLRFTFVFEKRRDRWLCVHSHHSLPAAKQDEGG